MAVIELFSCYNGMLILNYSDIEVALLCLWFMKLVNSTLSQIRRPLAT